MEKENLGECDCGKKFESVDDYAIIGEKKYCWGCSDRMSETSETWRDENIDI